MSYTLGSLFDGSGGFPLSGTLCGIEPRWAAEVEPYPIAVTRTRFPHMRHLGDISKINGAEIEPVDIITFGSPCQDLSVAGKGAGIKHAKNGDDETTRSGLFMEAVRIIKEMRQATDGKYPTFALWENVPGAFSSNKGEDFRIVLEELIKVVEPTAAMPEVPSSGWAYADSYVGDGWSLAYRLFDAQYWGVAQRRRRIHLVLDLRGQRAREVLFEREGVRGYFAQGKATWEEAPADAQGCSGADDCQRATDGGRQLDAVTSQPVTGIIDNIGGQAEYAKEATINGTLRAGAQGAIAYPISNHPQDSRVDIDESSNMPMVMESTPVYGLDRASFSQGKNAQFGFTVSEDKQPTLTAQGPGAVAQPIYSSSKASFFMNVSEGAADTLMATDYKDPQLVAYAESGTNGSTVSNTLIARMASAVGTTQDNLVVAEQRDKTHYIVRRLTPTECARLQGFPDRWGDITEKDALTDEEYRFWMDVRNTHALINGREVKEYNVKQMLTWYNKLHTDSAEYKMWGNGIALPPALYVLQGMADALSKEEDSWMM